MPHELENTEDGSVELVLTGRAGWHGLGIVVKDAPSPKEARRIAGLDWLVAQAPIHWQSPNGNKQIPKQIPKQVANYRTDKNIYLGTVSDGYKPIQNHELSDFCQALAENGDQVKIESAGSIRNGQKVWFLMQGASFSVRAADEVCPYILASNGHDGGTSMRLTHTTIRVVCSNTLHAVIPNREQEEGGFAGGLKMANFACRHVGDIKEHVEAAKESLKLYGKSIQTTRNVMDRLAASDINSEKMTEFLLQCFVRDFGSIPLNPTSATEENKAWRAKAALKAMLKRFETEKALAGATLWNAFNSYTGWLQHEAKNDANAKDKTKAADARKASVLFGTDSRRTQDSLLLALKMAG